jgi:hypothetical protein
MHGVPISKISTCGATLVAKATVPSKSNESNAIWVCAMLHPPTKNKRHVRLLKIKNTN